MVTVFGFIKEPLDRHFYFLILCIFVDNCAVSAGEKNDISQSYVQAHIDLLLVSSLCNGYTMPK